ncbi:MAG: YidC/Oxa1 family membrane protein insertase [Candidatus Woesebacteria bacterium]
MEQLFTHIIYQPFLNILVFFYWLLGQIPGNTADMGIAVILMTLVLRFMMLPISIASDRSEHEREEISKQAKALHETYRTDPVMLNKSLKVLMRTKPRVLISEFFEFAIDLAIIFMLIRIFSTGLKGADLHLLYTFVPHPQTPYNLLFLGKIDLSKPSILLNIIQSFCILLVEVIAEYTSPFRNILSMERPVVEYNPITNAKSSYAWETRSRVRSLQFFLPVVSFIIFLFLPAGKKLFIITALLFTAVFMILKAIRRKFVQMFPAPVVIPEPPIPPVTPVH